MDVSMWQGHRAYIELADDGPGYLTIDAIAFGAKPPSDPMSQTAPVLDLPDQLLKELTTAKLEAEKTLPHPSRLPALEDATPWPAHVNIRGNPNNYGPATPGARFLEVLAGRPDAEARSAEAGSIWPGKMLERVHGRCSAASWSIACGKNILAKAWCARRTTSASLANRRLIRNCSITWQTNSFAAAGRSNICIG